MAKQNVFEIEQQAQRLMTRPVVSLIKNLKVRIPENWGFGIIFFEHSRTAPPTFWVSSTDRKTFVDVADEFVKTCRRPKG